MQQLLIEVRDRLGQGVDHIVLSPINVRCLLVLERPHLVVFQVDACIIASIRNAPSTNSGVRAVLVRCDSLEYVYL